MEVIELSGYTIEEKMSIANKHLVRKAMCDAGLQDHPITFNDELLKDVIINYTRESGVRQCDRVIRTLCSKIARSFVETQQLIDVNASNVEKYLGPRKYLEEEIDTVDQVGITNGLAWTMYGGEMLKIEAVLMPGRGKLTLTGQLGDVMKESAQAALSYARSHSQNFGIDNKKFTHYDLHIHVPAGAIPKDGPSAGITMLTSILSTLTGRSINAKYAMTGELNLRGEVMPIGGVKEKVLAAKRNKMLHVILPSQNKNDLVGMEEITKDINVIWVKHAQEVIDHVLSPVITELGKVRRS
jgi:ATP-dependent Lon protease